MKNRTVVSYLSALAGAMILLTACGGGGGGGVSSSGGGAAAPAAAAGGTVGGVAAKGIVSNANVTAYCGNSEATADQLATGVTDAAGQYNLTWTTACAKPVMLVVTAGANTSIADEATGTAVIPPAGFALRALLADPDTTTVKNITPLTDMAAAIAGTSTTLSKTAASNAETAIINTVLGGDIGTYQARPLAPTTAAMATASADERKLATLLTAVSAFAQDDAICKAKLTVAERIKCATDTFAAQAKATVTGVSDEGYTVATTVPASTPATMLADALAKIKAETASGTSGDIITAAGPMALASAITSDSSGSAVLLLQANAIVLAAASTGGFVPVAAAYGVQAARDLFNSLKNDLLALSDGSGTGYLDQKVSAMNADWSTLGLASATGFVQFVDAVNRAAEMANEAKSWPAPPLTGLVANAAYPVAGRSDLFLITDSSGMAHQFIRQFATFDGLGKQVLNMNCRVFVTEMSQGKAGCYYGYGKANVVDSVAGTSTTYFRGVKVAEGATNGSYTWNDFFASRVFSSTQLFAMPAGQVYVPAIYVDPVTGTTYDITVPYPSLVPLADAVYDPTPILTGTATLIRNTAGETTNVALNGDIQPLATGQDYSTLDISSMNSSISGASKVASLTGTVTNVKGSATTLSMSLQSGSQVVISTVPTPTRSTHPISMKFITQIKTTAFQYDGTLIADSFKSNLKGEFTPTNASFSGKISTLAGGSATEFLRGTLGATLANWTGYDPSLPPSASNYQQPMVTFGGKATNGSKTYEMTFIADGSTYGQESVTLNYSRTGSQMVSVTGIHTDATNATVLAIKGTGDVNAVLTNGTGDVFTGTTKVGTITRNPSQVNFTDGTYLLLGV